MRDTHCCWFEGACEHVQCIYCPDRVRPAQIVEGMAGLPDDCVNTTGVMDPDDTALFLPDTVMHPNHYARWALEPIEFIAINDLPWWLANIIKYTMRFDAKDGLQDLYKARSYLEMKIREVEGHKRFWDKPVAEERKLKEAA